MKLCLLYSVQVLCLVMICWQTVVAAPVQQQMKSLSDATGEESEVISGKDGWLFLKEEVEHLASTAFYGPEGVKNSKAVKPEFADPLPAIVDFNNQLKDRGIELLFVLIPPKALIYPDKLPGDFTRDMIPELSRPYKALYGELEKQGVQVLDMIPVFNTARDKLQVYCKTDTHFSGQGLAVVAGEISQKIKQRNWYASMPRKEYTGEQREIEISGDLSQMQKSDEKERLSLFFVRTAATGKDEIADPDSPVLLLGDSHTLVFSVGGDLHTRGAGLFDRLSLDLGFPVDLLGVRGSGATASRIKLYQRSRKNPEFLGKKKIIIWCLSARELTGSGGWRKIPVAKK